MIVTLFFAPIGPQCGAYGRGLQKEGWGGGIGLFERIEIRLQNLPGGEGVEFFFAFFSG